MLFASGCVTAGSGAVQEGRTEEEGAVHSLVTARPHPSRLLLGHFFKTAHCCSRGCLWWSGAWVWRLSADARTSGIYIWHSVAVSSRAPGLRAGLGDGVGVWSSLSSLQKPCRGPVLLLSLKLRVSAWSPPGLCRSRAAAMPVPRTLMQSSACGHEPLTRAGIHLVIRGLPGADSTLGWGWLRSPDLPKRPAYPKA